MKKLTEKLFLLLFSVLLLGACKSSRLAQISPETNEPRYLSSKIQLTVPYGGDMITVGGTMKMKSGERMQLSILMPVLRSEMIRIDVTPDEILFIDRMNKRYVRANATDANMLLPRKISFAQLEKILFDASNPGSKAVITGKELKINSLEAAKLRLYDFSTDELLITPTEVSSQYTPVELDELMKLLIKL